MISIIIPNLNGMKFLNDCLNSLNTQTFSNYEIILVDNGSNDESISFVHDNYPKVIIIAQGKNYGFAKAVNDGINASKGEYIFLLNNDTICDNKCLENLLNCIKSDNRIFSCQSKMLRMYERDRIDSAGDFLNILAWAFKRGDGANATQYMETTGIFSSCGGAVLYKKEFLIKLGLFDEAFFAYLEDVDISYRAKISGYKNIYCANSIVYHAASGTSGSKYNEFKISLSSRNNIYLIYKNTPIFQLIINLPFYILGFFIKTIFFCMKGYGKVYAKGLYEGIRNLADIKKFKFSPQNIINYVIIEFELILNILRYIWSKSKEN